jgi:hypothetical protein
MKRATLLRLTALAILPALMMLNWLEQYEQSLAALDHPIHHVSAHAHRKPMGFPRKEAGLWKMKPDKNADFLAQIESLNPLPRPVALKRRG